MRRKLLLGVVTGVVTCWGLGGVSPAYAEGQTERGPEHANSICSYSGLNDDPEEDGMRVQSYGALVAAGFIKPSEVKSGAPSPGFFCNGHRFPLRSMP
jgi:hypothetical protein